MSRHFCAAVPPVIRQGNGSDSGGGKPASSFGSSGPPARLGTRDGLTRVHAERQMLDAHATAARTRNRTTVPHAGATLLAQQARRRRHHTLLGQKRQRATLLQ